MCGHASRLYIWPVQQCAGAFVLSHAFTRAYTLPDHRTNIRLGAVDNRRHLRRNAQLSIGVASKCTEGLPGIYTPRKFIRRVVTGCVQRQTLPLYQILRQRLRLQRRAASLLYTHILHRVGDGYDR